MPAKEFELTISVGQLRRKNACHQQVELFQEVFGQYVSFKTKQSFSNACAKARRNGLDISWARYNLHGTYFREGSSVARARRKWADAPVNNDSAEYAAYKNADARDFANQYWDLMEADFNKRQARAKKTAKKPAKKAVKKVKKGRK